METTNSMLLNDYEVIWKDETVTNKDIEKAISKENAIRTSLKRKKIACFCLSLIFACLYKVSPVGNAISYHMLTISTICFVAWAILFCSHLEKIPNTEQILGFLQEKHLELLNHLNNYKLINIEFDNDNYLFHFMDNNNNIKTDSFTTGLFGNVYKKYENGKTVKVFDFSSYNWDEAIKELVKNYNPA